MTVHTETEDVRAASRAVEIARSTRAVLANVVLISSLLWGVAAGLLVFAAGRFIPASIALGVLVTAGLIWRGRAAWSLERIALWVEEHEPKLQYAFVTAVDVSDAATAESLEAAVGRLDVGPYVRQAVVRNLGFALGAVAIAVLLAVFLPARGIAHHTGSEAERNEAAPAPSRLTPLHAHIVPPAYARRPTVDFAEPSSVTALVGSTIVFRGSGDTAGVSASVSGSSTAVASANGGWQATIVMPSKPSAVQLDDRTPARSFQRLVILDPVPDRPPTVVLTAPARDTVIREPATGTLVLTGEASDDIGLADGDFEYIITSGEEDAGGVKGREGKLGRETFASRAGANTLTGTLHATLSYSDLGLKGGDVLSIRAVVHDNNAVSGPGQGTSETRTIRIATKQEYDSIAVEGAPPSAADSAYMSQRMIVLATEAIRKREVQGVVRDTVVKASRVLAQKQETLRQRVSELLYGGGDEGGGGGETMPEAERVLFDTAYQAMTDAAAELGIASPKTALPPERVALAMLDSVRKMQHRLYLRGAPPTIVVNIQRVRLAGTELPNPGQRTPGPAADTLRVHTARRFWAAVGRLSSDPSVAQPKDAVDSLSVLRVDALSVNPLLAAALTEAVDSLQAHHDVSGLLRRARSYLGPPPAAPAPLALWQGEGNE